MVVLGAGGDRGGRGGGGGLRRCCSGAEVEQREVMSFNAYGVHTEQMQPSEGAGVEGFKEKFGCGEGGVLVVVALTASYIDVAG